MIFVAVFFYIRHGHRFDPPGVVDQDLAVDSKYLIKYPFVPLGPRGDIAHRIQLAGLQTAGCPGSDLPEIRDRLMVPEKVAIGVLVQLCYPYAVFVRSRFLGDDVHGDFCQVKVSADARGGGNAGRAKNIPYHGHGHHMGGMDRYTSCLRLTPGFLFVKMQVGRAVDKYFIDGIDVYVLLRSVFEVHGVDLRRDPLVFCHPGNSGLVKDFCVVPLFILANRLFCFEEPRAPWNSDRL